MLDTIHKEYNIKKVGAARLLYQEVAGPILNWQKKIQEVDFFLAQCPALHIARSAILIYFPLIQDMKFEKKYWIGREIIGHMDIQGQEHFFFQDFPRGISFSYLLLPSWSMLSITDFYSLVNFSLSSLKERKITLGTVGRILIEKIPLDFESATFYFQGHLQFFLQEHLSEELFDKASS